MAFPVDIQWVTETEARLGVRFPASFVSAMVKRNGGSVETEWDVFYLYSFLDASDRKRLRRTCSSIDRETKSTRESRYGFPPNAVVIGHNGGGDLLVLMPMADHPDTLQHSVYLWNGESDEPQLIADDFADLRRGE
ncbi:SMI1/KNR4 family protein [Aeoliella mucimassa]|uniref:SMI1 / KNR4 family protein n=1 Tax=Aeoliella mucimassa TaxID=2527972 RepID=A0A518AJN2_9BACT|nr:SMI1/KNR4 family protein [Aeoliella mucimassa]QDU54941.1 SMI1 / KNR4 family protein [Aeoliella mucimassa]